MHQPKRGTGEAGNSVDAPHRVAATKAHTKKRGGSRGRARRNTVRAINRTAEARQGAWLATGQPFLTDDDLERQRALVEGDAS